MPKDQIETQGRSHKNCHSGLAGFRYFYFRMRGQFFRFVPDDPRQWLAFAIGLDTMARARLFLERCCDHRFDIAA